MLHSHNTCPSLAVVILIGLFAGWGAYQGLMTDAKDAAVKHIIVISDEAHRTQSGRFARNMRIALPNAAFIGFTGTPIALEDKDTRAVFGDYIHVYDMQQAKEDGATVAIYYESRMVKLGLKADELTQLRSDEVTVPVTERKKK